MQPTSGLGICGYGSFFLVCGEVPDMLEARVHADLDQPHAPVFVPIDALVSTGVPATLPSVLLVLAASSDTEITATKVERVPVAVISLPHVARPKFEQESIYKSVVFIMLAQAYTAGLEQLGYWNLGPCLCQACLMQRVCFCSAVAAQACRSNDQIQ